MLLYFASWPQTRLSSFKDTVVLQTEVFMLHWKYICNMYVKVRYSDVVTTYRMKSTLSRFTHSANEKKKEISSMLCLLQAPNFN